MERRKERTRVARNSTEQTTERNGTAEQRGGAAQKSQLARMAPAMNKAPFHYHGRDVMMMTVALLIEKIKF